MAVNAFATRFPAQPLDMAPKVNAFTNMTAPAPASAPPAQSVMNAFAPRPQAQPKAPGPSPVANAFKAFATGFAGPEEIGKIDDRYKADAQAKAKAALVWMQHTAQQPADRRAAFTLQSAQDIARDTGQPYEAIVASAQDPNAFSDEALNAAIGKFSAMAGIAPAQPEPMSAFEAEKIKLEREQAGRPTGVNLGDGAYGEYDPASGLKILREPTPKPAEGFTLNPGDVRYDGQGNRIASVAPLPPKPDGTGQQWRAATPADVQIYNLPDTNYLIGSNGDVKQITDSRKTGQVPASIQTMEQKYLDTADAETARLMDLTSKYQRFNALAKDWNSQGEGIWNDMGQALSMETSSLKAITSELIGKMRSPGEGVMTDADAKRLENATVGINQTREGNQLAERIVTAAAQRAQDRALFLRQWVADNGAGSLNQAKLAWNKYSKQFPIYNASTGEPNPQPPEAYGWASSQGFADQSRGAVPPVTQSAPVRINSKEERDALPAGAQYIAPDGSLKIKR